MVDPRTPVLIGVGQFTERIDDADYRGMSAVDLATEAARAALADTGVATAMVAAAVDADVVMIMGSEPGSTRATSPTVMTSRTSPSTSTGSSKTALVARDQVNQGAAAVMMSVEAARRLGVPEDKWVYVHGHADMIEQATLDRADLGASPASVMAAREALRVAGIGVDDIATFDLYSCFPFPVFVICDRAGQPGLLGVIGHRWHR
jgi:hypothetical protein